MRPARLSRFDKRNGLQRHERFWCARSTAIASLPTRRGGYFWYPSMDAEAGPPVKRFGRHCFDCDHAEYLELIGA